ncbi:MAG TPA: CoA transferase [Dehalococcoidia bacterium]|jgi:crotonobetainyl-CoA:carnitine CoA-transferase CaiB-like acyl-CoA transferase
MAGPLAGIRVLEFSEIIAAPFAGMLLSDMGADIIKVEPLEGEPWRLFAQFIPTESRTFMSLNRGKRDLTLDLTKPEAQEIVRKLVPEMDVVMVNYRPDVSTKLGIDYSTLSALNPKLIYCDNTAFGRKGPQSHRPGYDIIVQGATGVMAIEGKMLEGVPTLAAIPIADYSTGMMMAWSICAALYHREKTGRGQLIETTLLGSALAVSNGTFQVVESVDAEWRERFFAELDRGKREGLDYEELKKILVKVRPLTALGNIQYRVFKTKDSYIVIGALSVALRRKLTAVIGVEDKRIGDPNWEPLTKESRDYARGLVEAAEAVFKEKTTDEWLALFDEAGVPAGPFKFTHELVDDEQVLANNLQIEVDHPLAGPVKMVGAPLQMSETPLKVQGPSPTLGQHNEDILSSLGYDDAQIAALRESGVIR